jgi:hypothetical protein
MKNLFKYYHITNFGRMTNWQEIGHRSGDD